MAKNERIIAQDLAEIRNAIQTQSPELDELCKILSRELEAYPVSQRLTDKIQKITDKDFCKDDANAVKEITKLIENLTQLKIS